MHGHQLIGVPCPSKVALRLLIAGIWRPAMTRQRYLRRSANAWMPFAPPFALLSTLALRRSSIPETRVPYSATGYTMLTHCYPASSGVRRMVPDHDRITDLFRLLLTGLFTANR